MTDPARNLTATGPPVTAGPRAGGGTADPLEADQ